MKSKKEEHVGKATVWANINLLLRSNNIVWIETIQQQCKSLGRAIINDVGGNQIPHSYNTTLQIA